MRINDDDTIAELTKRVKELEDKIEVTNQSYDDYATVAEKVAIELRAQLTQAQKEHDVLMLRLDAVRNLRDLYEQAQKELAQANNKIKELVGEQYNIWPFLFCQTCGHGQTFTSEKVIDGKAEGFCDKCCKQTSWKRKV